MLASLVSQYGLNWQALGARAITRAVDHDTIFVTGEQGSFHAIKLTVRGSTVRIRRVVLHFETGEAQDLVLHGLVPDGGETKAIHLKGDRRAIRSIEVWYDAKSVGRKGAVVELDGRD